MKPEQHTMRLQVSKHKPKPGAPKHYITTLDELFQVATLKNYKRLMRDLKDTFTIALNMEKAMGDKRINLKGWEWIDD